MRKLHFSMAAAVLATAGVAIAAPAIAAQDNVRGRMPMGDMTRAQAEAMAGEHFAKMDVNGDGVLNQADRDARRAAMVAKLDTDKDGTVSAEERAAARANRPERPAGAKRAEGDHAGMDPGKMDHGKMGHGGKMGMRGHRGGMGKMADTNNDGTITRAEFTAGALARFAKADADGNGTVTQAERQAAHEAMKAEWQARKAAKPAS